jgi:hypothetical protein
MAMENNTVVQVQLEMVQMAMKKTVSELGYRSTWQSTRHTVLPILKWMLNDEKECDEVYPEVDYILVSHSYACPPYCPIAL